MRDLAVVMPVYNEEASVEAVLREWCAALDSLGIDYRFFALNDGSKDGTLAVLRRFAEQHSRVEIIDKSNSGHGQTCIEGYRRACETGFEWVLQIDSDGQCDPHYIERFWHARDRSPVLYGLRWWRKDGLLRFLISRIVSVVILVATGTWILDPNVPYRLMRTDKLKPLLERIPNDFYLANILLAVLQKRTTGIFWVPIVFLDRTGGTPSVKMGVFSKHGRTLIRQLRALSR